MGVLQQSTAPSSRSGWQAGMAAEAGFTHTYPTRGPRTREQHALLAERVWWPKAHKGCGNARAARVDAEAYEPRRGVNAARSQASRAAMGSVFCRASRRKIVLSV